MCKSIIMLQGSRGIFIKQEASWTSQHLPGLRVFRIISWVSSTSSAQRWHLHHDHVGINDNFINIYFMKNKDEVFSKFKEFKALIENHTENKIKTFRLDNGREFTSNQFKELCKDSRIKREFSTPYNLQQNGIVERIELSWNMQEK